MKCLIVKNGHVVDMPRDIHTQVLVEAGILEKLPERNPVTMCNFHWVVSFSTKGIPVVEARCMACRLLDAFFEQPGQPGLETRYVFHKRVREHPPADIIEKYRSCKEGDLGKTQTE